MSPAVTAEIAVPAADPAAAEQRAERDERRAADDAAHERRPAVEVLVQPGRALEDELRDDGVEDEARAGRVVVGEDDERVRRVGRPELATTFHVVRWGSRERSQRAGRPGGPRP